MNKPTPEQTRRIKKAHSDLQEYWNINPKTKEIFRIKENTRLAKFKRFFWKKKHTVWEFYWWIKQRWSQSDTIVFPFPINSDNMPIKGFPMKYELLNGWTIPKSDLKYLTNGPLASEGLQSILVQHNIGLKKIYKILGQYGRIITATMATISFILLIVKNWEWISNLFR